MPFRPFTTEELNNVGVKMPDSNPITPNLKEEWKMTQPLGERNGEKVGIVEKVGEFLGLGSLGKGLGLSLSRLSPEIRQIEKRIDEGTASQEELDFYAKQFEEEAPTGKQVIGSALQTGLTIATAGGAGMTGNLARRIGVSAGLGAGFGVSSQLEKEGKITAEGAIGGALLGGSLPLAGKGLGMLGQQLTKKLPIRLVQSALNQSKKALLAGKDVAPYVLAKRKIGTAEGLINGSMKSIQRLGSQVQNILDKQSEIGLQVVKKDILDSLVKKINEQGGAINRNEVHAIIEQLAPQIRGLFSKAKLTISEANKMRQALDRTLGDRGFLSQQLPFNKEVLRMFDNNLREKIKTLAPETRGLFNELSKEITLRDALLEKSAKARNQIISFGDLLFGLPGGVVGGIPGAIGGAITRRVIQSTPFLTSAGVGLQQINKLGPIISKLTPAERTTILNALGLTKDQISEFESESK